MMEMDARDYGPAFRALFRIAIIIVIFGVLVGAIGIVSNTVDEGIARVAGTLTLAFVLVVVATGTLFAVSRSALVVIACLGLAGVGVGSLVMLAMIWGDLSWEQTEDLGRVGWPALFVGSAMVHTAVFRAIPTEIRMLRVLRIVVWVAVWMVTGFVMLSIFANHLFFGFGILTVIPIAAIPTAIIGTIAYPIAALSRAARGRERSETFDSAVRVRLGCPKCGERGEFTPGQRACASCKARLVIELEEPRCACGYLLYRLTASVCPECGTDVPETLRWHEAGQTSSAGQTDPSASSQEIER